MTAATISMPVAQRSGTVFTRSAVNASDSRVLNNADQSHLEDTVLRYQQALENGSQREIDQTYEQVCRLYPPLSFIHVWYKKYHHLYDSKEDFVQEYLFKFCKVLQGWKPRHLRKESRYDGKGTFANYFWGALDKMYSNQIKAQAAAKRSQGIRCPLCETWSNSLSTHIFDSHPELLFEQVETMGIDISDHADCPLCKSHKPPRRVPCTHHTATGRRKTTTTTTASACESCQKAANLESLKKHLLDKHSSLLFERFRSLYPNHVTLSVRPLSVNTGEDEEGNERDLYEAVTQDTRLENLLNSQLSDTQRQIVESILFQRATALTYDPTVYKVSAEEFERELESLKTTMTLCGWKDTDDDD